MNSQMCGAMLENIQRVHAYVVANPRCGIQQLCDHFDLKENSIRKYIGLLRDSGHVYKEDGERRQSGQAPAVYFASILPAPTAVAPVEKRRNLTDEVEEKIARRFVPAKQVGMHRDALVAALFGAGPAAHA